MRFARPLVLALALAVSTAALPAASCSPAAGYRVPSNLELAAQAEAIVLGQVVAGQLDEGGDPFASTITVRPIEALKGALPAGDIALAGMMLSRDADPAMGMLSNPYEFESAHPVSYIGACTRFIFPLGTTALFFLARDEQGKWSPAGGAFARWAEDVPGRDAPWVALTRLYLRAAALTGAERAAMLESERAALRARVEDPVAQLMAADLSRQLALPAAAAEPEPFARVPDSQAESAVDAALRQMRQEPGDSGN